VAFGRVFQAAVLLFLPFVDRNIAAHRNLDANRVFGAFVCVILLKQLAQLAGLDAHQRIAARVEGFRAGEDVDADRVALQLVAQPFLLFLDHVIEKSPQPFRARKRLASKDLAQAGSDQFAVDGSGMCHLVLQKASLRP